ncbi:MerR family transcriptional regulator [Nakamurella lactea]|uniref:MerR family transcriptional regulator n=1 Tax=Nakamurella lactea TaxID=459515 RepID=UPI00056D6DB6|nr:MerR family transcriptional regulator [Nakamurella lactea]
MTTTEFTVGALAELSGVSVRRLHHYDEIGLLVPTARSSAGYRLYSPDDLQRLQRILFYRELGFELAAIATILSDPATTAEEHLQRQHGLLTESIARRRAMLALIERELSARRMGISLTAQERLEVFGGTRLEDHADRAEQQWGGDSEQWSQRQQRTARYTKQDWLALRSEQADIHQRLLDAMCAGIPPDDSTVTDLAEEHRRHLERWHHDCDYSVHRRLAEAYRNNERIGRNFDDMAPGLSRYIHDAIVANCELRRPKI